MSNALKTLPVSHAYVMYTNGTRKLITTKSIAKHVPKDKTDFRKEQKYKIWLNGDKGKDDILLNAFILLLGVSEPDVKKQLKEKRLQLPNKRNMSFMSNCGGNVKSKERKKNLQTKAKAKKKLNLHTEAAKNDENEKILAKHLNLMENRKTLGDSDNESYEDETQTVEREGSRQKT